jgi:hypothetical protein
MQAQAPAAIKNHRKIIPAYQGYHVNGQQFSVLKKGASSGPALTSAEGMPGSFAWAIAPPLKAAARERNSDSTAEIFSSGAEFFFSGAETFFYRKETFFLRRKILSLAAQRLR